MGAATYIVKGKGIGEMMDVCKKRGLSEENSTLVIDNPADLSSTWRIYDNDGKYRKETNAVSRKR
jgi:hypothetical protein